MAISGIQSCDYPCVLYTNEADIISVSTPVRKDNFQVSKSCRIGSKISEEVMSRLIVVSNRLPVSTTKYSGEIHFTRSAGGLATGLSSLCKSYEGAWIGWPGTTSEKLTAEEKNEITGKLADEDCLPVFLSQKQVQNYYHGFCNKTIWPLFHYFPLNAI